MQEEADFVIEVCGEKMNTAIVHLEKELVHIRAGKASPAMLDGFWLNITVVQLL